MTYYAICSKESNVQADLYSDQEKKSQHKCRNFLLRFPFSRGKPTDWQISRQFVA